MKRLCVPAVLLVFCAAASLRAQENNSKVAGMSPVADRQPAPEPTQLTPRQKTELRADIHMAKKEYPEAITAYREVLKQDPKNAVVLNKVGIAYEIWGDNGKAEHYFKKAVKSDKTYASAYNNVGTVEYARKHYRGAIKWYLKALQVRPEMAPVYLNLGYAYFSHKDYQYATTSFRDAILLNPMIMQEHGEDGTIVQERGITDPGEFYFLIARTYAQIGDALHTAIYLKIARDDGYPKFDSAKTDPAFARVIKDRRVQAVFLPVPELSEKSH